MEKSFEQRKQDVIDHCKEIYANKPSTFWKRNKVEYKTTLELVPDLNDYIQTASFYFIKNNMGLVRSSVLGILPSVVFGYWLISNNESIWFVIIFIAILIILFTLTIKSGLDRKSKIIFTPNDFWVYNMHEPIAWKHLITSYFKLEHSGDDINISLLIHYYDERRDAFTKIEFLISGLEMNHEDISFHIEKFKEKNHHIE
jgi:hypothetical protein